MGTSRASKNMGRNKKLLDHKRSVDNAVALPMKKGLQIREALSFSSDHGPVRTLTSRVGEVANLADPWENQRSKAAILAKKYQELNQRLRNIYNAGARRELTNEEVASVFQFMEAFNGYVEDGVAGADRDDGGSLDSFGDGHQLEDPEEGGGDGGDDEDMASGLAGSEEIEGDPCL